MKTGLFLLYLIIFKKWQIEVIIIIFVNAITNAQKLIVSFIIIKNTLSAISSPNKKL